METNLNSACAAHNWPSPFSRMNHRLHPPVELKKLARNCGLGQRSGGRPLLSPITPLQLPQLPPFYSKEAPEHELHRRSDAGEEQPHLLPKIEVPLGGQQCGGDPGIVGWWEVEQQTRGQGAEAEGGGIGLLWGSARGKEREWTKREWAQLVDRIGICYGMSGDNLPSPPDVVALYKKYFIEKIRIYNPNPEVQNALQLQDINVALGVRNEDIPNIAASQEAADTWVSTNISPYNETKHQYVVVGNEIIGSEMGKYVASAMANLRNSLISVKLTAIRVTTSVSISVLSASSPPSQGTFAPSAVDDMTAIVSFLNNLPPENPQHVIMVNVHPYFAYAADPEHISQDFALNSACAAHN